METVAATPAVSNTRQSLDLAAIGNGRMAALIDGEARVVWWCFPRIDADPLFCQLIAGQEEKGFCDIALTNQVKSVAKYLHNTAMLETILADGYGNSVRVTDFIPRFRQYERIFHPPQMFRRIEPLSGLPRVRIRVRPTFAYGASRSTTSIGSNHIRYSDGTSAIRLTTDAALSYIDQEADFSLTRPVTLILGPDAPLEGAVEQIACEFRDRTIGYWRDWSRSLAIPLEWQGQVIRAAITLKLCSFDETGAIVAALTTSIPEAPSSERTWDYRYCWPRDAYFVVKALNGLGATQTMESFLGYITNIATDDAKPLRPVYGIVHSQDLTETIATSLRGYQGIGPVRIGNQAAEQWQHDTYGSIILAVSQMFIDERLPSKGDTALFHRLEVLGEHAKRLVAEPDAGPWEYRGRRRIHTYSAAMCWAACDRLAGIAAQVGLPDRQAYWRQHANLLRAEILRRSWSDQRGAFAAAFDDHDLDASCLLLPEFGLIDASDSRFVRTVDVIGAELSRNGYMLRYTAPDDFGVPEVAFLACQFWYIDALHKIGRCEQARELFEALLAHRNPFGLLSEDLHPSTHVLWGNLPQTYSMAGIVNSALRLSAPWSSAWSRPMGTD